MGDKWLILIVEVGAVIWIATWIAEVACRYFLSTRSMRTAYWSEQRPMECPACGEIEFTAIGVVHRWPEPTFVEYECEECGHYETH